MKVISPADLELIDYSGSSVLVKYPENALYEKSNLPIMLEYNQELLKRNTKQ